MSAWHKSWKKLEAAAEAEVERLRRSLPDEVRQHAEACPVLLELEAPGDDEEVLLGLFEGACLLDPESAESLPRIHLFLPALWEYTGGDMREFLVEVGRTYLHELGHYLGWDEEDMVQRFLD